MRLFLPIRASLLTFAAVLLPAAMATAQCPIPRDIVTASRALTDAERSAIDRCVEAQVALLKSSNPADVSRGRQDLVQPPRTPGVTDIFRRAYADAVRAKLRDFFKSDDEFRAVNALSVLPFLLTAESLEELADNASPLNQPREAVRIAAARFLAHACRTLGAPTPPYSLNPAQADALARKTREAADRETSWVALAELASALTFQAGWRLPPQNLETVRGELIRVLQRQIELAKTTPEVMRAVQRTLVGIRRQVIDMPAAARPDYGRQLSPVLRSIKTMSTQAPPDASESLKRAFTSSGSIVDQISGLF
ncbi:MAG: hypothetical protein KF724_01385 [Phycisphaeraceae bacterium]|nr:hypothetical protein [Phycisphaeraceae bacterium]